ncbi:MAG: amidase [Hyphomonadaceae bacterium]|jgi:Asp-tRNA(Asn)/Glu-tRNA(Gln) amidotransferase A subunit family amidase|nr:amidase [Hyphomonadaceae bacterium]
MQSKTPTSFAENPGQLRKLAAAIATKTLSPVDLMQRYLDRIAQADPHVQCWRALDAERALDTARQREEEAAQGRIRGPLHGIPVAIKDIIDVEGLPTRANCRARASAPPASNDAEVVLALKTQGAVVLGKVHTTEFAFFDPSPARNPHNVHHTPGGSSSGSAAVVAGGMAPVAVGTQTVASVNRPAAYCGIAAFKPSTCSLSTFGITPLGPSYDTPGFYGWGVDDAVYAYEAIAPAFLRPAAEPQIAAGIAVCIPDDPHILDAIPEMRAALARCADACASAGHRVERPRSPISFERLHTLQRSTTAYEAGRALRFLLDQPEGTVGETITALIREGLAIQPAQYLDERTEIDGMRQRLFAALKADVFLWPATPSTAPEGLAWTGDPKYISPWTALGGPIVSLPAGLAANGLPLGCILTSHPGTDARMRTWARALAQAAA